MQPAGAGKSGFKTNRGQGFLLLEQLFGVFDAGKLEKFLGTYTGPFLKKALKMKRAQMNLAGDFIQIRLLLEVFPDVPDGLLDTLIV